MSGAIHSCPARAATRVGTRTRARLTTASRSYGGTVTRVVTGRMVSGCQIKRGVPFWLGPASLTTCW
jgi:hypothetical protein